MSIKKQNISSVKRHQETLYTFVVWPAIANVHKTSGYLFIKHFIVHEVALNNFDMGGTAFTVTNERLNLVDFTIPIMDINTIILAKIPKLNENIYSFLSPFSCETWIGILLSFISSIILLSLMLRWMIDSSCIVCIYFLC